MDFIPSKKKKKQKRKIVKSFLLRGTRYFVLDSTKGNSNLGCGRGTFIGKLVEELRLERPIDVGLKINTIDQYTEPVKKLKNLIGHHFVSIDEESRKSRAQDGMFQFTLPSIKEMLTEI
ncbi:MAG: hypothetical protein ACPGO5_02060 [Patescibacteria group bacterium]